MAVRCNSPWRSAQARSSKRVARIAEHARTTSDPEAFKYRWEASIPYNWSTISKIPLERVVETAHDRNLYEALCEKRRFIVDLCQAVSPFPAFARSRSLKLAARETENAGRRSEGSDNFSYKPQVPRVVACASKSRSRRSVSPDTSTSSPAPDPALTLTVTKVRPKTQEMPFAIHKYAFPHHRGARRSKCEESRCCFKNPAIEEYLTRFERKAPHLIATSHSSSRQSARRVPKMVNVSVQESGLPSLRDDP